jgi:hypothetical protein
MERWSIGSGTTAEADGGKIALGNGKKTLLSEDGDAKERHSTTPSLHHSITPSLRFFITSRR